MFSQKISEAPLELDGEGWGGREARLQRGWGDEDDERVVTVITGRSDIVMKPPLRNSAI